MPQVWSEATATRKKPAARPQGRRAACIRSRRTAPKRNSVAVWSEATITKKNPLPEQGVRNRIGWLLIRAPHHIRGQITLGSFQEFEFNGFAFVQRAVPVFLDCGEVDED